MPLWNECHPNHPRKKKVSEFVIVRSPQMGGGGGGAGS